MFHVKHSAKNMARYLNYITYKQNFHNLKKNKKMEQIKVETKAILDIRGKELKYVIITKGKETVIINVGDKTYENTKNVINQTNEQSNDVQIKDTKSKPTNR